MKLEAHIFNSKSFVELIDEAIDFFIQTPTEPLPPDEKFPGGGVYALYYSGNFTEYKRIFEKNPSVPIYVGKAVLPGWRQARGTVKDDASSLYSRLKEHSRSIDSASNLELNDFSWLYRDEYAAVAGKCQLIRQRNLNRWKFLNP